MNAQEMTTRMINQFHSSKRVTVATGLVSAWLIFIGLSYLRHVSSIWGGSWRTDHWLFASQIAEIQVLNIAIVVYSQRLLGRAVRWVVFPVCILATHLVARAYYPAEWECESIPAMATKAICAVFLVYILRLSSYNCSNYKRLSLSDLLIGITVLSVVFALLSYRMPHLVAAIMHDYFLLVLYESYLLVFAFQGTLAVMLFALVRQTSRHGCNAIIKIVVILVAAWIAASLGSRLGSKFIWTNYEYIVHFSAQFSNYDMIISSALAMTPWLFILDLFLSAEECDNSKYASKG